VQTFQLEATFVILMFRLDMEWIWEEILKKLRSFYSGNIIVQFT